MYFEKDLSFLIYVNGILLHLHICNGFQLNYQLYHVEYNKMLKLFKYIVHLHKIEVKYLTFVEFSNS